MPVLVDASHPLQLVVERLSASGYVSAVALVGSRVSGLGAPDSDYDVFIYTESVWLGTSVEDQLRGELRIPHLVGVSARVRFLSCQPLLGPVDLTPCLGKLHWVMTGGESGPHARPCDRPGSARYATSVSPPAWPCSTSKTEVARPELAGETSTVGPGTKSPSRGWRVPMPDPIPWPFPLPEPFLDALG